MSTTGDLTQKVYLLDKEELVMCESCEDYVCPRHDMHFADCTCQLRDWVWDSDCLEHEMGFADCPCEIVE